MIPKLSSPLVKFIRTGEGVLTYVFGLALVLVPIITSSLPPALAQSLNAGKWTVIAAVTARTGLKVVALLSGQTGLAPIAPTGVPAPELVGSDVKQVLDEIHAASDTAKQIQSEPGTPAAQVKAGLHPTDPQAGITQVSPPQV